MRDFLIAGRITVNTLTNYNKHNKIDNKSLCNNSPANQGINHVG